MGVAAPREQGHAHQIRGCGRVAEPARLLSAASQPSPCTSPDAQPHHRTDSLAAESRHGVRPPAAEPVAWHAARCNARRQMGRLQEAGRKILALLSPPGAGRWMLAPLPSARG